MGETERVLWPGWETVRLIGKGSFGAVYEIQRELFGETEKAALKVITIPQSDSDIEEMYSDGYDEESITSTFQNHLKSIISEYTLMRKLNGSANVVNCDDVRYVQHDDGIGWDIYIKMELLTPLNKVLPENIPEEQVLDVGGDICRALVLCKEYNIIHRDIKPQNIFVSDHKDYKLGDFGIAKTVEKTSGGTKIGTYKYMAPEVYHDEPYGASADIYSLGLVLYWMLNERRMPFLPLPPEKLSASAEESARRRRLSGEPLPAPAHGSEELKRIVLKACAYDPKDRYQSAAEMLSALESMGKPVEQVVIPPVIVIEDDETIAPEPEEDETIGAWIKSEEDKTFGAWTEPENEPNDDKTVSAWTKPKPDKAAPAPTPEKKPKKNTILLIIAACLVLAAVAAIFFGKSVKIVDISAGAFHTVGLQSDGRVSASGNNFHGQCNISDWSDIVAISAGDFHTVGLKSDGTVVAVGNNEKSQCNVSSWSDIVAISAGSDHSVGLRADGMVVAVGNNGFGQCNVSNWHDIVAISAGPYFTVGLKSDGTVLAIGNNNFGQYNDVSDWSDIVAISAGCYHTVGLKSDGTVVAVGDNEEGQCNVSDWRDVVAISAGGAFTVGLRADGTVLAVGNNDLGQYNDVSDWSDIVAISAGDFHTVGLKSDGTVIAVGEDVEGQCDVSDW